MSSYPTTSQYIPHKDTKNIPIQQYKFQHPAQNSKQYLQDLLTCHVCYCTVNSPMMCPNCAKLYCEACIKKCLQMKSQCPYCRKQIKGFSNLANCSRFVNEIVSIVQQLIDKKMQQQICQDHNIALNYYCQQCLQPVCCQCSMFGKHKNHGLKQIGIVYEQYYEKLREKLEKLKIQLNQKQINIKDLQGHLYELRKLKEDQLSEIRQYTNQYKGKILKNTAHDISGFQRNIFELDQYIKDIVQLQNQIINSLEQANRSNVFVIDQTLQKKVNEMISRQIILHNKSKNVLEQVIPPYSQFHFVIKDFSLKRKQRNIIFSPIEKIQGCEWRLKVYPNGNEGVQQNYLSIFIELVSSLQHNATYQYQIQLINKMFPHQKMIRQYSSTFEAGQCWGYNKYIKLQNLLKDGYIDPEIDQLQIRYYLRNPLYYNVYEQKKIYIQSLDDKILQQQAQLAELKKMLEQSDL